MANVYIVTEAVYRKRPFVCTGFSSGETPQHFIRSDQVKEILDNPEKYDGHEFVVVAERETPPLDNDLKKSVNVFNTGGGAKNPFLQPRETEVFCMGQQNHTIDLFFRDGTVKNLTPDEAAEVRDHLDQMLEAMKLTH